MSDGGQPDRGDDRVLAGEYTIGLLPADEAAAFEARLPRDQALRGLCAQWEEDLGGLTDHLPAQAPPARVWRGIEADLFGTAARRPWYRGRVLWWGGAVAVVALVLAIGLPGLFDRVPRPPVDAPYAAELAAEDRDLIVRAVYDATTARLFLAREAGDPAPGRALELWLIAGEDAPVSLGVLPQDSRAVISVPDTLRDRVAGSALAISDEPAGGSPTSAPTGDILAVGQVRNL